MGKQTNTRQADLVTAVLLFAFGAWIIGNALQMPLTGSLTGVKNYWYTSPALLPLFIGSMLMILSMGLFIIALRAGALKGLSDRFTSFTFKVSPLNLRVIITIAFIIGFVYVYVPYIDFFLNIVFFLSVFMISFYFENKEVLYRTSMFVLIGTIVFGILIFSGIGGLLTNRFVYSLDVLQLIYIIALAFYTRTITSRIQGNNEEQNLFGKKRRIIWIVSILVPLILIPIFRFGLRVPLPKEGGIIQLLNLIVRSLR